MFFETNHSIVTDSLELTLTLSHNVTNEWDNPSWEGVEFHSVQCVQSNRIFYSINDFRSYYLGRGAGQAIRCFDRLIEQTEYRFDYIMQAVEII